MENKDQNERVKKFLNKGIMFPAWVLILICLGSIALGLAVAPKPTNEIRYLECGEGPAATETFTIGEAINEAQHIELPMIGWVFVFVFLVVLLK